MSLLEQGRSCLKALRIAKSVASTQSEQFQRLDHIINRLMIWAGAIGFFAPGSAGIEHRFKDDDESREVLSSLLDQLLESAELFYGETTRRLHQQPRDGGTDSDDADRNPRLSVVDEHEDSEASSADQDSYREAESESVLCNIEETVDLMFRLLHLTRASSNQPTKSRVLDFRTKHVPTEEDERLESMLRWYIEPFDAVDNAKRPGLPALHENKVLIDRVINAALFRSWRMQYKKRHAEKLAQMREEAEARQLEEYRKLAAEDLQDEDQSTDDTTNQVCSKDKVTSKVAKGKNAHVVYSDTVPSVVQPLAAPLHTYTKAHSIVSKVGSARRNRLPIPPAPKVKESGYHETICPYCRDVVGPEMLADDEVSRSKWSRHLVRDWSPYLCLADDCEQGDQQYRTIEDWATHMRTCHTLVYCCQSPGHEAFLFERAGDLRHHLEIHHHDELELEDIADILEGGALPSMDIWHLLVGYDPTDQDHETPLCRLCGQTAVSTDASASSATRIEWLLNHIGSHFEDIALQCLHAQLLDDDLASAGSEIALDADLSIRDVHELPPVIENASEASTMQATSTASEAGSLGASSLSVLPNSNLEGEGEPPSSDRAIPSLNEDSGGELRSVTDLAQPTTDSKAFNPPVSGVSQPDRHLYAMSESLPPMMETDGPELIVAVDFGMTYTAVAYVSCTRSQNVHHIQRWPGRAQADESKVPTEITYNRSTSQVSSWGFGCQTFFEQNDPNIEYCQWFKAFLDPAHFVVLKAKDPKAAPPSYEHVLRWTRDYLRALYLWVSIRLDSDCPPGKTWDSTRVEFVFSAPSTWYQRPTVEHFRQIIQQAGWGSESRHVVRIGLTEACAAAIYYAREIGVAFDPNDVFLVLDCGGGTTDLNIVRVQSLHQSQLAFEQLSVVEGEAVGSTQIDLAFEDLIYDRLRASDGTIPMHLDLSFTSWAMARSPQYQDAKCSFGESDDFDFVVHIPDLHSDYTNPQHGIFDATMQFRSTELKALFDTQVTAMVGLIEDQLQSLAISHPHQQVQYLVLSGGLLKSGYVQRRIEERYTMNVNPPHNARNLRVLVSGEPRLAVCKGLCYDRMGALQSGQAVLGLPRLARSSYGLACEIPYDLQNPQHHRLRTRTDPFGGQEYITNGVTWLLRKGETFRDISMRLTRDFTSESGRVFSIDIIHSHLEGDSLPLQYGEGTGAEILCRLTGDLSSVDESKFTLKNKHRWQSRAKYLQVECEIRMIGGPAGITFDLRIDGQTLDESRPFPVE